VPAWRGLDTDTADADDLPGTSMKLARKLILALVVGIFSVMAFNAYLRLQSQETFFKADSERDLRAAARALASGVEAIALNDGEALAQRFVRKVNLLREEIDLRWVWVDELGVSEFPPGLSDVRIDVLERGDDVTFVRSTSEGQRRFMYWPLPRTGPRAAALELSEPLDREHSFMRESQLTTLLTALGVSIVCALMSAAVGVWFVGRPMRLLSEKARRVGSGDLSGPLVLRQRDEVGELAEEINAMCDRLAAAQAQTARETEARIQAIEQLRHVDRLRTVGQLASGVAHELGTPLNVVSGHAGLIRSGDLSPAESAASTDVISEQTRRMASIIRQLLDFSRRTGPRLAEVDLREVTAGTLEMLAPLAEKRGVVLRLDAPSDGTVAHADWNQMQQAIANLVMNAIQATPPGGEVSVTIDRRRAVPPQGVETAADEFVDVCVRDAGDGIAAEHLPHVFDPFFTTKDVGEGTGLGLAVAYGIVREHGGWIEVESEVGAGTRFAIVLPPAGLQDDRERKAVA
jgi:signal transduction histidine kinase